MVVVLKSQNVYRKMSKRKTSKKFIDTKFKLQNLTFCIKCIKSPKNLDSNIFKTKNNIIMQSKCAVCGSKKSRFVKEQEAKGLMSKLGLKA